MSAKASVLSVRDLDLGGETLSCQVGAREVLAVLGDNGSGKSLFLACLSGHLRTPPGTILINGEDLPARRGDLGVVFQHPGLIRNMTVFENVALPFLVRGLDLDGELEAQVRLRLELVGCGHLAGLDVNQLSEGDKRCVALARALSGGTRWLVADEPTASLSPGKRSLVEELLATLVQTGALTGMVLATQDLDFALRLGTVFLILQPGGHRLVSREDLVQDEQYRNFAGRSA